MATRRLPVSRGVVFLPGVDGLATFPEFLMLWRQFQPPFETLHGAGFEAELEVEVRQFHEQFCHLVRVTAQINRREKGLFRLLVAPRHAEQDARHQRMVVSIVGALLDGPANGLIGALNIAIPHVFDRPQVQLRG